jgi:predicted TIM-barrel fold metal-dependent hydrolase
MIGRKHVVAGSPAVLAAVLGLLASAGAQAAGAPVAEKYVYSDAHFHLTNYIQEGTDLKDYLKMMDGVVKRSTVFGLPLQQMWQYGNTGDFAPYYYLQTDAPLYYYSFTDAMIAMAYKSLAPEQQARLDPMIIGFNPADMYGADHIRRVLLTFPGVFSGIGEFSIHKEFVSSKIAGGPATLGDPALHRILDFAAESGLVVLLHNDIDMPFPKEGQEPYLVDQMKELLIKHPDTTVIWAHLGVGRIVRPLEGQADIFARALASPQLKHLYLDISWDETAKYVTSSPEAVQKVADLINKYPDRFLFGSDVVAPKSIDSPMAVYKAYEPLWEKLTPEAKQAVLFGNYERLFDAARVKVRAWEKANLGKPRPATPPTPISGYKPASE